MSKLEPTRTCSNPTANEILRRMLDERGVEWRGGLPTETIVTDPIDVLYVQRTDGMIHVYIRSYLTPEQAIAATLGTGTCHIKPWKMEHDTGFFDCMECSECGYVTDVSEWAKATYCAGCGRRIEQ